MYRHLRFKKTKKNQFSQLSKNQTNVEVEYTFPSGKPIRNSFSMFDSIFPNAHSPFLILHQACIFRKINHRTLFIFIKLKFSNMGSQLANFDNFLSTSSFNVIKKKTGLKRKTLTHLLSIRTCIIPPGIPIRLKHWEQRRIIDVI